MGFFANLFGKKEDTTTEAPDVSSVGQTTYDMATQQAATDAVAAEDSEHMAESTEEAREAMHDAAAGTPAEATVEETLEADKQ